MSTLIGLHYFLLVEQLQEYKLSRIAFLVYEEKLKRSNYPDNTDK